MRAIKFILITLFFSLPAKYYSAAGSSSAILESDSLPYYQIPDYPDEYNMATVVARMIDGLGYRYYWATEGLNEPDLNYEAGNNSRSCKETLVHLFYLSRTIKNGSAGIANIRDNEAEGMDYKALRKATLENIQEASQTLKATENINLGDRKLIFTRGDKTREFEFWHLLNGPLSDAIYHVGQIVSNRRASGNPLNPFVSVFMGKTRE